jgi:ABC-type branched-subunit amino acid transport system substrate-binding protein
MFFKSEPATRPGLNCSEKSNNQSRQSIHQCVCHRLSDVETIPSACQPASSFRVIYAQIRNLRILSTISHQPVGHRSSLAAWKGLAMSTPQSPLSPKRGAGSPIQIGALVPLSRPGWVEAGQHLLCGLELAVREVNDGGGVLGRPVELIIRDTAADPQKATAAVDELARLGVDALAGEYHSVVARAAAARADSLGLPFLCSSAVLDALTEQPTDWVARLSPAQSHGWRIYADYLLKAGHGRIAVAIQPSVYWASGTRILRDYLTPRGGTVAELDMNVLTPMAVCDELVANRATALLLLVGDRDSAASLVTTVRRDPRLADILIGAPAGQAEFAAWVTSLGRDGHAIPFLRYLPERITPLGMRVDAVLRERLAQAPSFVAFEGYDTIVVLAEVLRLRGEEPWRSDTLWSHVVVEGTRGEITFSRAPGVSVWQWVWPPVQVVDRDPDQPGSFRVLHAE